MANTKITSRVIADDAILTANIADDQITSALIADDVALGGNPTTSTQTAGNNTTRIATTAFVSTAVSNLVDSSPSALNTLNELAAALGDDANFSTTVTNSIAAKLPLAGGTMTGNIGIGAAPSSTIRNDGGAAERALQIGNRAMFFSDSGVTTDLQNNSHLNNSDVRVAMQTDLGSLYQQYQGIHKWFNAASVSAGATQTMTSRMVILADGKVGIGTDDPAHNLHVVSSGNAELEIERTGGAAVFTQAQSALGVTGTSSNHDFGLLTNGSVRMRILTDGKVGIGTASPDFRLVVKGAAATNDNIFKIEDSAGTKMASMEQDSSGNGRWIVCDTSGNADVLIHTAGNSYFNGGNVGIGTASPSDLLHLVTSSGNSRIRASNGTATSFSGIDSANTMLIGTSSNHIVRFMTNDSERMRIDSSGKVGIGSTSPDGTLHLKGSADTYMYQEAGSSDGNAGILFQNNSGQTRGYIIYDTDDDLLLFQVNQSERMRIASSGNVGIGTTSPVFKLHLKDAANTAVYQKFTNDTTGNTANDGSTIGIDSDGDFLVANAEAKDIKFFTSDTERMRISSSGNVGINTTSSGDKLSVCGTVRFNTTPADGAEARHYFTVGGAADAATYTMYDGSQNAQVFFTGNGGSYFTGGNLGVGDNSPAYRLELPNTASTAGQGRANDWNTYSDSRIKSNIQTLSYGLDVVKQLKPSQFKHHSSIKEDGQFVKQEEGTNNIGFIAQEVLPLIPEVVSVPDDTDKDLYSISYPRLTAVLTKAIQEQQTIIEDLKARIETLEG